MRDDVLQSFPWIQCIIFDPVGHEDYGVDRRWYIWFPFLEIPWTTYLWGLFIIGLDRIPFQWMPQSEHYDCRCNRYKQVTPQPFTRDIRPIVLLYPDWMIEFVHSYGYSRSYTNVLHEWLWMPLRMYLHLLNELQLQIFHIFLELVLLDHSTWIYSFKVFTLVSWKWSVSQSFLHPTGISTLLYGIHVTMACLIHHCFKISIFGSISVRSYFTICILFPKSHFFQAYWGLFPISKVVIFPHDSIYGL